MSIKVNAPTNTEVLKNKALLVRLERRKINRNKTDKLLSEDVRQRNNVTEAGALRVSKSIFTKEATDPFGKLYNDASKYFYRVTLPWDERGYRLMAVEIYEEFIKKFKTFTNDYRKLVNHFIDHIEENMASAKEMLGDAYRVEDYKFIKNNGSVDFQWLNDAFALEVEFNTVTDGDDLRAVLTETDREAIAEEINKASIAKFTKAQEHIVVSLIDCVKAIHERLCQEDHVFRDTLITNLEDLCDLVPKLNINGDPAMNDLASECKAKLCKWDPQTLRDDTQIRADVSKEADDILKNAKGLI